MRVLLAVPQFSIAAETLSAFSAPGESALPDFSNASTSEQGNISVRPSANGLVLESTIGRQKVVVTPEYSNQTGLSIGGAFASMLGDNAAVGVLLTVGSNKKEWLINAGYKIDERQHFIVTAGQLQQFLDYTFLSGTDKVGMTQNSGALSYQFQLGNGFLRSLEVKGYLANTASRDLADKTFAVDTANLYELWSEQRRIAGGTVTGLQGKLGFSPSHNSVIKVSFGQERLSYDLLSGTDSVNRLTGGGEWAQQLGGYYQLKASADTFASQNRYTIGIDRSLAGSAGRHHLGASLISLRGRDGMGDDTQFKLSYTYVFSANAGNGRDTPMGISPRTNAAPDPIAPWSGGGALLDQVAHRPSFIPSHVVAKIDKTAQPTRLIAIDKTALPTGSTISAAGDITTPLGVAVINIVGVTKNLVAFTNTGQFSLVGNSHVTKPSLIAQPALGVIDSYVVTINNDGGGATLVTVLVSHGSVKIDSIVVTPGDTTPDAFTFVNQTNVMRNTLVQSAAITVTGINTASSITVTGGEYLFNGGAWTASAGTVTNGQVVLVRHTSSGAGATATNTVLTIGGVSGTFTTTTTTLPDGYVTQGGLSWMPVESLNNGDWAESNTYCTTQTINGQTGWRLPTKDELQALYYSHAFNGQNWYLSNTWTSTPSTGGEYWTVDLGDGSVDSSLTRFGASVTCVR